MKKVEESPWIQFRVETIQNEEGTAGHRSTNRPNEEDAKIEDSKQDMQSQEGDLELQNILRDLNEPINLIDSNAFQMDSRYFKLEMQKEYKLLIFENMFVHSIFSLLVNMIG